MAAYMRNVLYMFSLERNSLLSRGNGVMVESKRFIRGLRRKPVRVLFPDAETGRILQPPQAPSAGRKEKQAPMRRKEEDDEGDVFIKPRKQHSETVRSDQTDTDRIRYETALPGDKRLARLASVARSRSFRENQGKVLLEGRRLICDALSAGANPQIVFFSTLERLRELPLDRLKRASLVKVKFEDIKIWSDVVAPQGVIAIFSRPDPLRMKFSHSGHSVPLTLICDNIRDPGNLGTILRCAAAAGCHSVLLTKGCVDAWEPKVLRAAMGAHFCLPIYPSLGWAEIEDHLPKPVTVHVADHCSRPDRAADAAGARVDESHRPSGKAADYGWVSTRTEKSKNRYEDYDSGSDSDSDSDSDSEDERASRPQVGRRLYHETWAQSPSALVIGGETHGLSEDAMQLAGKTAGQRLYIPVVPEVDSLNSAMAASVLLFEGRKQLLKVMETSGKKEKREAQRRVT
ncbi:rRNA methyltransferase 3A, mitochondrial [Genypterus blacodes]|uniref:rRNA methyltransferase 3A, mitochondrial n=1 Tax=Genypterus blacodes TaxID=154954 RepID=UPI003F766EB7